MYLTFKERLGIVNKLSILCQSHAAQSEHCSWAILLQTFVTFSHGLNRSLCARSILTWYAGSVHLVSLWNKKLNISSSCGFLSELTKCQLSDTFLQQCLQTLDNMPVLSCTQIYPHTDDSAYILLSLLTETVTVNKTGLNNIPVKAHWMMSSTSARQTSAALLGHDAANQVKLRMLFN